MIYVSIDLETTGLDPETCQVLEIGAVAQELGGKEIERFHAVIDHKELYGSPFALSMNQRLIQMIADGGAKSPYIVWRDFYSWLDDYTSEPTDRVIVAGKNFAGFDRPFIERSDPATASLFFHRVLDPAMFYMKSDDDFPPSLSDCLERAGLPNIVTHSALADAVQVRDLIEHHFSK